MPALRNLGRAEAKPQLSRHRRAYFSLYTGLSAFAVLLLNGAVRAEIVVDGRFDEPEWTQAVRCGDWRRTQPFALDQPRYGNDIRIVATAQGLAAAFTLEQPPQERRMKPRTPRDSERLVGDSVSLMVDFDANAQVGYEFSVGLGGGVRDGLVTNQNKFDRDWDGTWWHAVRETDDRWFVEILIPWATVNMRQSDGATRAIGVYATRYLFDRNERFACPGISEETPAFLADFQRIEIPQHRAAATFDFIPYGTAILDNLSDDTHFKVGADLIWKPSPNLWLSATLNPDFGQVESDELVVDFSGIETVFTDKRPFFTENQGIFDLRPPANGQLVYTRRVGAAPDDGSAGSTDIDAALKITGNADRLSYGAFVAQEDDYDRGFGRLFAATRLALPVSYGRIGYFGTWTDHPLIERDAMVNALDYDFTPNDWWRIAGQVIRSDIDAGGFRTDGYQAWVQTDLNRSSSLTHTVKLLYIDDRFDLNDLGYMERNSLRQVEWDTNRRVAAASAESRITGETQRLYLVYRENAAGQRLQSRIQLSRDVQYNNAWRAYEELRVVPGGVDDLILSRGNGPVKLDTRVNGYADFTSPRFGNWQFVLGAYAFQQGVEDYSGWLQLVTTWYAHEKLTLRLDLLPQYSDDWLLWEEDNLFGSYRARRLDFDFRLDWIPAPRHELRIKWQWIGIHADPRRAYLADPSGRLRQVEIVPADQNMALTPSPRPPDPAVVPFTVNNLGVQIRYRYEIAPQSELFLVYARGGYDLIDDDERGVGELFRHMRDVRDSDQFLIKFRYRL
ncbi:MAG TPA: DUF5916 domain-containing protein [Povalibacter sp.]|nr:DUF5916 domain-containing protein [Povalibacter sp.]